MSIRMSATTRPQGLQNALSMLDSIESVVADAGRETYDAFAEPLKRRLSEVPGPVKRPVQWTSEKQRRAYFASNGFGNGIPYQRSGALPAAWQVDYIEEPGTFRVVIYNPAPAARFVYGALGRTSQNFKQPMHTNTGWLDARPIIDVYTESMTNFFITTLRQRIGDFNSSTRTRAYTGS